MELIYVTNKRIPTHKAHGYQIAKMCEAFAARGAKVSLWVPTRVNTIEQDVFSYYDVKPVFDVRYIKSIDFIHYKILGKYSFFLQLAYFMFKMLFIRVPKDAVLYTRNPELLFVFWLRGKKVIYEDHGWPKRTGLYLFLVKKAYKVVAITQGIKQEYLLRNIPEEKITVAADAVDLQTFNIAIDKTTARAKLGLPLDKKIVTYTGSFYLYKWKGVDVLLGTEPYLPENTQLVLVGGDEKEIATIKNTFDLKKTLLFSKRPRSDIALFLKASDVLVLPNKTGDAISEKYTSPLKLFEYMASGVPIVASSLPSITEILSDTNAWLVQPDNAELLAQGITSVITNPAEAEKRANRAFADVQEYTWEKRAARIIEYIQP
jgi:glycosyltransferase involved in cell wall biosynthesis